MSGKKRVRHSPKQIVEELQETDRLLNAEQSVGRVLQTLAISEATYHSRRQQYGGMKAEQATPAGLSVVGFVLMFRVYWRRGNLLIAGRHSYA